MSDERNAGFIGFLGRQVVRLVGAVAVLTGALLAELLRPSGELLAVFHSCLAPVTFIGLILMVTNKGAGQKRTRFVINLVLIGAGSSATLWFLEHGLIWPMAVAGLCIMAGMFMEFSRSSAVSPKASEDDDEPRS